MTSKISHPNCLRIGVAVLALLGITNAAHADFTPCEAGKITMLMLADGGESEVRIVTEPGSGLAKWKRPTNGAYATAIWYDNDVRWAERLKLLRTAFVLGQEVQITSNDPNCMGPSDEFDIRVFAPGQPAVDLD